MPDQQRRRPARQRWYRSALALGLATALALGLVACGSSSDDSTSSGGSSSTTSSGGGNEESSKEPFKVLAVLPMSGPLAVVGELAKAGYEQAAAVVNSEGGIIGHEVELKIVDDGGSGEKAVTAVNNAAGEEFNLISCGDFGEDAIPCAEALVGNSALQIPLAAEKTLTDYEKLPNVFVPGTLFNPGEKAMAEQAQKDGYSKIAIVVGDGTTGRLGSEILKEEAEAVGLEVATTVYVPEETSDATPQLQQAQSSGAEAILISGYTVANGPILAAKEKIGWKVPVYGDWYFSSANLALLAKPKQFPEITMEVWPWDIKGDPATETPEFEAFYPPILKKVPEPALSVNSPLVAFQPLLLARAAAEKAESIEGPALVEAMAEVEDSSEIKGWIGPSQIYTPTRHHFEADSSEFRFIPGAPTEKGLIVPTK